jgi:hypothetical protein
VSTIYLGTDDGRNARVSFLRPRRLGQRTVKVSALGEEVFSMQVHRGSTLLTEAVRPGLLIEGDPEIDFRNVGRILHEKQPGYRYPDSASIEGAFQMVVTTYAPDGSVRDRSRYVPREPNINGLAPVRVGRRMPLSELFSTFAFHNQLFLGHEDGLQHAFLLALARSLEQSQEAAMLGTGPKGTQPLILQSGGPPTRAFLIGDTVGERYRLRMLLTRLKLTDAAANRPLS